MHCLYFINLHVVTICDMDILEIGHNDVNTRLICLIWFGLMISDCQQVASRVDSWTNRGMSYCVVNHVSWLVLSRCGAHVRWSTMKVIRVHVNGPEAVKVLKDESWDLTEGPESSCD